MSTPDLSTHDAIIRALGGPTILARRLGLNVLHTTGKWPRRGIPPRHWHIVTVLAAEKGLAVDVPHLMATEPQRPARRQRCASHAAQAAA